MTNQLKMAVIKKKLTLQQLEFVKHLFSSEVMFNASEAYRRAYPKCKVGHNALAARLIAKDSIKQAIEQKRAETEEKLDLSREKQHKKLQQALELAIKTKSPSAMVSAIREQNEMLGYHRDKAPNTEREAAILGRMSEETKKLAQQLALMLTRKSVVSVPVDGSGSSVEAITGLGECGDGI